LNGVDMAAVAAMAGAIRERPIVEVGPSVTSFPGDDVHTITTLRAGREKLTV
jgi:hypothetical protein